MQPSVAQFVREALARPSCTPGRSPRYDASRATRIRRGSCRPSWSVTARMPLRARRIQSARGGSQQRVGRKGSVVTAARGRGSRGGGVVAAAGGGVAAGRAVRRFGGRRDRQPRPARVTTAITMKRLMRASVPGSSCRIRRGESVNSGAGEPRPHRAGQSIDDLCRACKATRVHTVIAVDAARPRRPRDVRLLPQRAQLPRGRASPGRPEAASASGRRGRAGAGPPPRQRARKDGTPMSPPENGDDLELLLGAS